MAQPLNLNRPVRKREQDVSVAEFRGAPAQKIPAAKVFDPGFEAGLRRQPALVFEDDGEARPVPADGVRIAERRRAVDQGGVRDGVGLALVQDARQRRRRAGTGKDDRQGGVGDIVAGSAAPALRPQIDDWNAVSSGEAQRLPCPADRRAARRPADDDARRAIERRPEDLS